MPLITQDNLLTLADGLAHFKAVYMPARNYSDRTREEYAGDIVGLISFLTSRKLTAWQMISLRDLQLYLAELDRRGLESSSRKRRVYAIKTFFKSLSQSGYLKDNPASQLIPPSPPYKERRFLREEEYQALLAQVHTNRDRAILELFLQTGLRLSELTRLNITDLELPKRITRDPENVGYLKVKRKGAKEVVLPLNWKACEALSAWLIARRELIRQGSTDDALFLSKYRRRMTARSIRYLVMKYLDRAGISGASVHTLRHTMATHYLAKGGDLKSVQEMLN